MVITLQSIIDYEPLKMLWVYEGIYFGHVMPKADQHTTNDDKFFVGLILVSVKMLRLDCKRLLHGQFFYIKRR
jgi:hypothetical protein